ncbi:MAG: helicase C-terminal domain-containing protein [bacterium]
MGRTEGIDTAPWMTPAIRQQIASEIAGAGQNEVFFLGRVDDQGLLHQVEVVARGRSSEVPVFLSRAEEGFQVLIHNHPGGDLTPSPADLSIASDAGGRRLGFFIVNNDGSKMNRVVEPFPEREEVLVDPVEIEQIFADGGVFSTSFPGYEQRPGQVEMAKSVARALNQGDIAALEAGTGIGKSYAYLVPAILWAVKNRSRVVVSTATIPLGEQLVHKDLPALQRVLGIDFRFALIQGRGNYACRRKTKQVATEPEIFSDDEERASWVADVIDRLGEAKHGTRQEMLGEVPAEIWSDFQSTSDQSLKARCPHYRECFYYEARRKSFGAHIVVVNHHLLFADLKLRRSTGDFDSDLVLPGYQKVIFDEGHHLEEVACHHLGAEVSRRGVLQVLGRLVASRGKRSRKESGRLPWLRSHLARHHQGHAHELLSMTVLPRVRVARQEIEAALDRLEVRVLSASHLVGDSAGQNGSLMARIGDREGLLPMTVVSPPLADVRESLDGLRGELQHCFEVLEEETFEPELEFQAGLVEMRSACRSVVEQISSIDFVLGAAGGIQPWIEMASKPVKQLVLRAAPLRVDELLAEHLYGPVSTVIQTSATLRVGESWNFLSDRLGWDHVERERIKREDFSSPFDWKRQVLLGLPGDIPDPGRAGYDQKIAEMVLDTARAADGRTFVLFTSHQALRRTAEMVRSGLQALGMPLLVQGEAPRSELLRRFVDSGHAVLFGNQSYWEGIDVPGAALSCVIIARLPFRIPNHPLEQGRAEELEARGKSPFAHLALPRAVLGLRQGFGRLIRTLDDRGVVVIGDARIVNKPYGKRFLASLPDCRRIVGTWDEVRTGLEAFFSESDVEEHTG